MDNLWEEYESGEIHLRDKWQFELKSNFIPKPQQENNIFKQEFYIFIPNSLQINDQTYSKTSFYEDQTNLIRFKTPEFTFPQFLDPQNSNSPLTRLQIYQKQVTDEGDRQAFEREMKLFANVFRSTLREQILDQIHKLEKAHTEEQLNACRQEGEWLLTQIEKTRTILKDREEGITTTWTDNNQKKLFGYVNDFLSLTLNSSLSALLDAVRNCHSAALQDLDHALCNLLLQEKSYRESRLLEPGQVDEKSYQNESILYQSGLLNKFFVNVLLLNTSRAAIDKKYRNLIGGFAAAIAMLFYILLFVWQGAVFVINSEPFILFTVIIYVLKDRLKEELKTLSFNKALRWFSDYKTEIVSPSGQFIVGEIKESFAFIDEQSVPDDIHKVRNREFHNYLETIVRPERVIYYKKNINIYQNPHRKTPPRLNALNIIFRFDIHHFFSKASDAFESHAILDSETLELSHHLLPKVYHLNIIIKNSVVLPDKSVIAELKKFRLVVDKNGIKRVEHILSESEV
jgi:hypothetical protein